MNLLRPDAGRVLIDGRTPATRPSPSWRAPSATSSRARARCSSRAPSARSCSSARATSASRSATRTQSRWRRCAARGSPRRGILDRPPMTLSFGQQKRLALAIGLALRPRTLILDEPSAGQDYRTAEAFMSAVAAIPGLEGLYFVTHDVDLALTHADRILVLRDGRIVADGPPASVIEDAELLARQQPAPDLADGGEPGVGRRIGRLPRRANPGGGDGRQRAARPWRGGRRVAGRRMS